MKKLILCLTLLVPIFITSAQENKEKEKGKAIFLVQVENSLDSTYEVTREFVEKIDGSEIVSINIYKTKEEINKYGYDAPELVVVEVPKTFVASLPKNLKEKPKLH